MIGFTIALVLYALGAYLNWNVAKLAKRMTGGQGKVNVPLQVLGWPVVVLQDIYFDHFKKGV